MSDPGDPQRPQQDRGYYGAGWTQPAPTAGAQPAAPAPSGQQQYGNGQYGHGQHGQQQYGTPAAPQQYGAPHTVPPQFGPGRGRPQQTSDPRRAFAPGASVQNTTGALIAVVSVVLVEFFSGVFGLIGTSLVVHPFSTSGTGESLVGGFVTGVFAAPFPYYVGAFLTLAFLTPVARRSPLPTVLLRALLAGAAGTIALALVGMVTGVVSGARYGGGARFVLDAVTSPLQNGLPFTLMLLASSTVAWLWLGRPRGARRAPGAPAGDRPPR